MYILHVDIAVKPDCVDEFVEATLANARGSVQEPGCARFDIVQDREDPAHFRLIEVYRNEAAVAAHKDTPHYAAWAETAIPFMAEPRTKTIYRGIYPGEDDWD
ncbi:MAG: antibiotic biosynthesis monooxygenase [Nitrospiraceae bacterium]|nr:antibiotic biosynthesis monooxygenase [Nitrospiraceae bacterium]